jgi:type IV pilus assembly protein PilC
MPRYRYTAIDDAGAKVKGTVEAMNEDRLRRELLRQNLEVQAVKERRGFTELEITTKKIPLSEVMHFSRQMAAFVRSGVSLTEGLDLIAEGTSNKRFRRVLLDTNDGIRQGLSLADALGEHASLLPPYYIGIIKSAELTGRLDIALQQLSTYIERELEAKGKIKSALLYPAVVLAMSLVTILILTTWVLPKFVKFFDSLHTELPFTTRLLIDLGRVVREYWFVIPALALVAAVVILWLQRSHSGIRVRDRWLLRLPVIGAVVHYSVIERICRVLAAMARAGVPIPEAMRAAVGAANNTVFDDGLQPAQERILEGDGLAEPIAATNLFPRAAVQMMRVGEATGTLDQQLENAAEYYSRELDYKLKRLTTLFEPAVIIVMGFVVGFVAIALVQAMYGIYRSPVVTHL